MNIENHNNSFYEILTLIQDARKRAYQQSNKVLMELYWSVGKYVSNKTTIDSWGKGVVQELADYIKQQDPTIGGFTTRNIWRMKKFYETYQNNLKLTPLVSQISWTNNLIILSGNKSDEEKDEEIVEYALSRSLSPTVIANYETELIPKNLLKQKVDELCRLYEEEK